MVGRVGEGLYSFIEDVPAKTMGIQLKGVLTTFCCGSTCSKQDLDKHGRWSLPM